MYFNAHYYWRLHHASVAVSKHKSCFHKQELNSLLEKSKEMENQADKLTETLEKQQDKYRNLQASI